MTRKLTIVAAVAAALALGCGGEEQPQLPERAPAGATQERAGAEAAPLSGAAAGAEVAALEELAVAILKAYKAKDVTKLAAYAPAEARDLVERLAPGDAAYEHLFDETGWRWKAAMAWDGSIAGVRTSGEDEAWLKYGEFEGGEIAVVALKSRDGAWILDDFKSPSRERWDGWGQPRK